MATPLSAIGKYAGVLMAVMCVLLMFAFVIGDPLMQYAGGGSRGPTDAGKTVVTWRGGSLTEQQMYQAIEHRTILAEFQRNVVLLGNRYAEEAGAGDLELDVRPVVLPTADSPDIEQNIVLVKIIADRAREAGMVVNDDTIRDYFNRLGRNRVSNDEMRRIIGQMRGRGGRSATIAFIFELMREALLVDRYQSSYQYIVGSTLPAELWGDWRRVNERIVLEAAPIPTERFLDQTPEPTEAELAEFFELYRNRIPSPVMVQGVELPSPDPAFATPPRVRLAYLKADFNQEVDRVAAEVTPDEVAEYYEANKDEFIEADRTLFGDSSLFGIDEEEGDAGAEAEESSLEGLIEEMESDTPETEGDATDPAADSETTANPETATDTTTEAATEDPETASDPIEEEEQEEEDTEEGQAETTEAEATDPLAETAAAETPVDETPVDETESTETESANRGADDDEPADDDDPADVIVYQPLEDVAVRIRQQIAARRTYEALNEKLTIVKLRLDDAYVDSFDALDEDGEPGMPDLLKDLTPLAEEYGLELTEVDQASQDELRETALGMSIERNATPRLPAWFALFRADDLALYEPLATEDIDGNRYLTVVTKRYDGETPELEDVREQVVAEWRRVKAAEMALEEAKKIAERATESGQPLNEFAAAEDEPAGVKPTDVFETDAFTFYVAQAPMPPDPRTARLRMAQPEPMENPGPDLLTAAFELDAGEVGAALNHDLSIAYLMRVAQKIGTEDELRRAFLRSRNEWPGSLSMLQARAGRVNNTVMGALLAESDLEWERPPRRGE